jgi:hypothetical protein
MNTYAVYSDDFTIIGHVNTDNSRDALKKAKQQYSNVKSVVLVVKG